jgi:hypothetical protein
LSDEKNKPVGSSFEDFLKKEEIFEETTTKAVKRVLSSQISQSMKEKGISKMEMAKRMRTSRSQLDRFLIPSAHQTALENGYIGVGLAPEGTVIYQRLASRRARPSDAIQQALKKSEAEL